MNTRKISRSRQTQRQSERLQKRLGFFNPVDYSRLNPCSYGITPFMLRGYYKDLTFVCVDCGVTCIWTASRQKWWYEVMQGHIDSTAIRCRVCRNKERQRKAEARRVSLEGRLKKQVKLLAFL